ncbi:MAG: type II secretion system protein [Verrucomicrobia bacterium]|jgi:prepilin-type N-terminal cleavage/methylation domain-containing protein|nr:type II secretion system protein [Verrucomicrobiota bacterium]
MTPRRRAGFTLIELLTVIAIIGILSAALFPAIRGVRKKAQQSSATTAFTQWAGGITRYKQVYGFYPNIGAAYDSSKDSIHLLEDPATNLKFVKTMSGRLPTGTALSTVDRKSLNKTGEEFCSFGKDDFEDPANLTDASLLVDRFGNRNIRVIFDTDNNTNIRNIVAPKGADSMPEDIRAIAGTSGIPARVIIFTTDLQSDFSNLEGSPDPGDYAQVLAIQ